MSPLSTERQLLLALAEALQQSQRWANVAPPPEALASSQPFCCDTLPFEGWLQFLFLPRCHALLDGGQPLPYFQLLPMAEMSWPRDDQPAVLFAAIRALDLWVAPQ